MTPARIVPAGDASLIVELAARIDSDVNARLIGLARAIREAAIQGVVEVVPAYGSLAVYFDPLKVDAEGLTPHIEELLEKPAAATTHVEPRVITVPVCYGGSFGPDLGVIAAFAGLSEADVVLMHASTSYRVFMLGFLPGFAYLGTVNPRIAAPRRDMPRARVAAGSVGIAGGQTGVYPFETPGGWQIVGRTPIRPCDFTRAAPFLFAPGDHVRFEPIEAQEFDHLESSAAGS
jgi:KipI family sensor histidine kinase inhibitor